MRWLTAQRAVPGIAISGDPDPGIRDLCLSAGFLIFLPKPVPAATLDEAILDLFSIERHQTLA